MQIPFDGAAGLDPGARKKKPAPVLSRQRLVGHFVGGADNVGCTAEGALFYTAGNVIVVHDWKRDTHKSLLHTKKVASCVAAHPTLPAIVASGESSGLHRVTIWDVKKRTSEAVMRQHKKRVTSITFSGDGSRLISCGGEEVYVWKWKTTAPAQLHTLPTPFAMIAPMAPPHAGFLVFGSDSLLDAVPFDNEKKKGMTKFRFRDIDGKSSVNFVAAGQHPQGHVTIAVTEDAHIADFKSDGKLVKWVRGLRSDDRRRGVHVTAAAISPRCICVGASDGKINVFDASSFVFQLSISQAEGQSPVGSLSGNPVAAIAVDGAVDVVIHAFYMDKSTSHIEVAAQQDPAANGAKRQDAKLVKKSRTSRALHGTAVWGMTSGLSMHGSLHLATCSEDGRILLWLLEGGAPGGSKVKSAWLSECLAAHHERGGRGATPEDDGWGDRQLRTLAVDAELRTLAAGDKQGNVYIFSVDVTATSDWLELISVIAAHEAEVLRLTFKQLSSSTALLASAGRDGFVHLWRVSDEEESLLHSFSHGVGHAVTSVHIKEDHSASGPARRFLLVSTSADGRVAAQPFSSAGDASSFDFSAEPEVASDTSAILDAASHPGETFLLTVGNVDMVSVRHLSKPGSIGQAMRKYRVQGGKGHYLVRVDPTGCYAALASYDGTVTVIDYLTGGLVGQTPVSGAQPTSLTWVQSISSPTRHHDPLAAAGGGAKLQLIVGDAEGCLTVWRFSQLAAARAMDGSAFSAGAAAAPPPPPSAGSRADRERDRAAKQPHPATRKQHAHHATSQEEAAAAARGRGAAGAAPTRGGGGGPPQPEAEPHRDPRLFSSGVLRDAGVGGKWATAAYQAFVTDQMHYPELSTASTMGSVFGGGSGALPQHPAATMPHVGDDSDEEEGASPATPVFDDDPPSAPHSEDEDLLKGGDGGGGAAAPAALPAGVELTKRSICAASDIESLLTGSGALPSPMLACAGDPKQVSPESTATGGSALPTHPLRLSLTSKWIQQHGARGAADASSGVRSLAQLAAEQQQQQQQQALPTDPHPSVSCFVARPPPSPEGRHAVVAPAGSPLKVEDLEGVAEVEADAAVDAVPTKPGKDRVVGEEAAEGVSAEAAAAAAAAAEQAAAECRMLLEVEEEEVRLDISSEEDALRVSRAEEHTAAVRSLEVAERERERRRLEALRAELEQLQREERERAELHEASHRLEYEADESQQRVHMGTAFREGVAAVAKALEERQAALALEAAQQQQQQQQQQKEGTAGSGAAEEVGAEDPPSPTEVKRVLAQHREEYRMRQQQQQQQQQQAPATPSEPTPAETPVYVPPPQPRPCFGDRSVRDPARQSVTSIAETQVSTASRLSRDVKDSYACKEGLDRMVTAMSTVCESLGVSVTPYGRPPGEMRTAGPLSLPQRLTSSPEDDVASVLTWMRSTIDGLLTEEAAGSPAGSHTFDPAASMSSIANTTQPSLAQSQVLPQVPQSEASPAAQQELVIQEVLRRLQSGGGLALPTQQ